MRLQQRIEDTVPRGVHDVALGDLARVSLLSHQILLLQELLQAMLPRAELESAHAEAERIR